MTNCCLSVSVIVGHLNAHTKVLIEPAFTVQHTQGYVPPMQDYWGREFVHIHGGGRTGGLSAYGSMPYMDTAGMYSGDHGSCCEIFFYIKFMFT